MAEAVAVEAAAARRHHRNHSHHHHDFARSSVLLKHSEASVCCTAVRLVRPSQARGCQGYWSSCSARATATSHTYECVRPARALTTLVSSAIIRPGEKGRREIVLASSPTEIVPRFTTCSFRCRNSHCSKQKRHGQHLCRHLHWYRVFIRHCKIGSQLKEHRALHRHRNDKLHTQLTERV